MQTRKKPEPEKEILDRTPPSDVDAEHCVLGSILIHPNCADDVTLAVDADDFYDDANQTVYRRMMAMYDAGKRVDVKLLVDALKREGEYERIGGVEYLAKITNVVPNAAHAVYYANIVRRLAVNRSLIQAGCKILQSGYDDTDEPDRLIAKAEQTVFAIGEKRASEPATIENLMLAAMDCIDERQRTQRGGLSTGYHDLDSMLGGLRPGELIIIAARPSMGKTSFALNICEHAAMGSGAATLFVSLEMSAMEVCERLLCANAKVPLYRCRNGTLSSEQMGLMVEAQNRIAAAPLWVDDTATCRVSEIAAKARRMKRTRNLGLIIVDYIQLLQPDDSRAVREQQVASMARQLKMLAKQIGVPVIVVAQLTARRKTRRTTSRV